ncbi:cytochrome c oxidase subunit I [Methylobacillus flagellatus]|uniref:cytochrome c oxidase subunit I n=1 Tax=Methylobacillus flagellatus TaxID=405 RepID=UPI002853B957|nr:cytochrome c oxidase subunit I [Methylobacillus flagellatus]MDR5171126.1 cytochrome c oxidase subunit I [Methylobacillus flagellatus]
MQKHNAHQPLDQAAQLEQTWRDPPGLPGWFAAINHKSIGKRFIYTTFLFFFLGVAIAGVMRLQLAVPQNSLIGPDLYNQLFTMHGSTMMFLFAVPVMQAMAVYFVPLMIGARSIAFPRLNAFAYWVYLFGGLMLYGAFLLNTGPDAGWFGYVPLAGADYSPGKRVDFWAQMITFTELSALLEAVILITTVFKLRAPGMSLNRIPLFVWSMLVTSFMVVFAMPAVMLGSTALLLDRLVGTHFYNPAEGGDALLWQHLFWFFGHPEVYLIFIPGLGFLSSIIATFARRPIYGYPAMVLSLITTGFLSFGLWVHHMFATNLPELGKSFFTAASMMIAIPSAVQIYCWIATLWTGRLNLKTPLLFALAFFFILVLGGMTGLMLASVPLDLQVHDTYFVVAHLHYVLLGGAIFPLFGAVYYWFPKLTGRLLDERLGRLQFWLFFIGFNVTFFPMHQLGIQGMPRRIYAYAAETGWGPLNFIASCGTLLIVASLACFLANILRSRRSGMAAGDNPWGAGTLEWATASPPPAANFIRLPVVHGQEPLWDMQRHLSEHGQIPSPSYVEGVAANFRQVLATTPLDACPDSRPQFPEPSYWPFLCALATTGLFIGSIFTPWAVVWGSLPVACAMIAWFWPRHVDRVTHAEQEYRSDGA